MADEKSRAKLLEKAELQEQLVYRQTPASRKYKSDRPRDDVSEQLKREIAGGTKVIVRIYDSRAVIGYVLATVLDFNDSDNFWSWNTQFIVKIEEVSNINNEKLFELLYRLRVVGLENRSFLSRNVGEIVAVGKENWKNYVLKTDKKGET